MYYFIMERETLYHNDPVKCTRCPFILWQQRKVDLLRNIWTAAINYLFKDHLTLWERWIISHCLWVSEGWKRARERKDRKGAIFQLCCSMTLCPGVFKLLTSYNSINFCVFICRIRLKCQLYLMNGIGNICSCLSLLFLLLFI